MRVGLLKAFAAVGLLGPVLVAVLVAGHQAGADGSNDPGETADWEVERLEQAAVAQLNQLVELTSRRAFDPAQQLTTVVVEGARSTALRPRRLERQRLADGTEIERLRGTVSSAANRPLLQAWHELLAPAAGEQTPRVEFKIVGARGQGERWSTDLRLETAALNNERPSQQVLELRIEWRGHDAGPPRIERSELLAYQRTERPARRFLDRTGDVLRLDEDGQRQLRFGGEYWYGRIDAVGEPNLLGHQGIAVADVNGDGLEDLYVAMGTGLPNKLLLRGPDGSLHDVADQSGVAWLDDTKGVLFADLDNDGDQDLLCALGPTIVLARNDGSGNFGSFVSMRAPTPAAFYSLSAADYDLDGDLDLFGVRYVKLRYGVSLPMPFHDANNGPTNHLLRNDGEKGFSDVTGSSGIDIHNSRFSLVGAWGDYDGDGDPDLYVANDFGRNNLYRNDGGTFVDVAGEAGVEDQAAGMGASWSDYDLDGDLDLYVTNMFSAAGRRVAHQSRFKAGAAAPIREEIQRHSLGNTLFSNNGDGSFTDVGDAAGVRMGRWGWGSAFADVNNDGWDDLIVPNGFLTGALEDDL